MRVRIGAYKRIRGFPENPKKWFRFVISQVLMIQCWIAWGLVLTRYKHEGVVVMVGGFVLAVFTTTALMWIGQLAWHAADRLFR